MKSGIPAQPTARMITRRGAFTRLTALITPRTRRQPHGWLPPGCNPRHTIAYIGRHRAAAAAAEEQAA